MFLGLSLWLLGGSAHASPLAVQAEQRLQEGERLRLQGRFEDANVVLTQAREMAITSASTPTLARAEGALGALLFFVRDFARATPMLESSLARARQNNQPDAEAAALNHLGMLAVMTRDLVKGRDLFEQAFARAHTGAAWAAQSAAALNLARLEKGSRKAVWLTHAREAAGKIPAPETQIPLLAEIGRQATALLDTSPGVAPPPAIPLSWVHAVLQQAVTQANATGDQRLVSLATGEMAALYETRGRHQEAIHLSWTAMEAATASQAEDLALRWEWQLGRLYRAQGQLADAIYAYRRAIRHLETIRYDIPIQYVGGRSSFRETLEPVYSGAADLLLQAVSRATDAPQQAALIDEAIYTMELLKEAEINDYFQDSCAARRANKDSTSLLQPATAILYPIILPTRLELLLMTQRGKQRFAVPIAGKQVSETARILAERLRPSEDGLQDYTGPAEKLHDWLIAPIEASLDSEGIDTLLFVPDGTLRMVPLGVLRKSNQFVIEKYAIATLTGLSQVNAASSVAKHRVLLAGISDPVQGFEGLPGVAAELQEISGHFNNVKLLNQGFNLDNFKKAMTKSDFDIVHIATHGEFGSTPEKSFLLTYDRKLDMNALVSTITAQGKAGIDLLSLSACHTAEGDDRAPLGLGGIAIKAGVNSALGSLWAVSDKAAERMIPDFYNNLKNTKTSKAKALQQAQLSLLRDDAMQHPFYWGPFVLIGNAL